MSGDNYNKHGHLVLTVVSLDLTTEEKIGRLEAEGFRLDFEVKWLTQKADYHQNHQLNPGSYRVILVPLRKGGINFPREQNFRNLRYWGMSEYGYGAPPASLTFCLREALSDKQVVDLGFRYIIVAHQPVFGLIGPYSLLFRAVFGLETLDGGNLLKAFSPGSLLSEAGAMAFFAPKTGD